MGISNTRMQHTAPERIVFRFDEKYQLDEAAIVEAFSTSFGPIDDYYSHLCPPDENSKMYIVLDVHAQTNPNVDPLKIAYRAFKVK